MANISIKGSYIDFDIISWGFNPEVGYFFTEKDSEDGGRTVKIYMLPELENDITIYMSPEEVGSSNRAI